MNLAAPEFVLVTATGLDSVGGLDGLLAQPWLAQTPAGAPRNVLEAPYGELDGTMARLDGSLVVPRDEYCAFMAQARGNCPA